MDNNKAPGFYEEVFKQKMEGKVLSETKTFATKLNLIVKESYNKWEGAGRYKALAVTEAICTLLKPFPLSIQDRILELIKKKLKGGD